MTDILRIRNWSDFQHYKDRCPPWIKLHFRILSSKDWVMLDDRSRVLAVACMLIASQSDDSDLEPGEFEADEEYIKRVAYLNHDPDFKPLIKCGFLEVASGCKRLQANDTKCSPETEAETEAEKRERQRQSAPRGAAPKPKKNEVQRPNDIDEQVWSDFLAHRRQKRAKLTPTAWKPIRNQLDMGVEQGHEPNAMLAEAMSAGWQGFKFEWYLNRINGQGRNGSKPPIAQNYSQKHYEGTPDDELPESLR
ncbi:MAG: hypothetical protein FKY71_16925 [Spiribacter salinus]|uniref:DUF1376 domain-containing protein n=1 Tax=Spiribacter salinus TaxID=1335746 RepID=A0A540VGM7_9GAMM|nr:MAG: hypothetical protein FKY71_16925 [Spiribacter salinus]